MWISQKEYNRIKDRDDIHLQKNVLEQELKVCNFRIEQLNMETKRLARLISEKTGDCQVGPWCDGCVHCGTDKATTDMFQNTLRFSHYIDGEVRFCKKHIHELCPEYEFPGSTMLRRPVIKEVTL